MMPSISLSNKVLSVVHVVGQCINVWEILIFFKQSLK